MLRQRKADKFFKRPWKIYIVLILSIILNFALLYTHKTEIRYEIKNILVKFSLNKKRALPYAANNKCLVYGAFLDIVKAISPLSKEKAIDFLELPNSLIIPPGKYKYSQEIYDLNREGLYRFINPEKNNQQRIIYASNLDALLSGLSWVTSHGNSDDFKPKEELISKAAKAKLFLTCGKLSEWACWILNNLNIKSRLVGGLTLDDWNSYNNGHRLVEVFRQDYNKWVCYDLDNNTYFLKNNTLLSLIEFNNSVASGDYELVYLSSDAKIDVSQFIEQKNNYDYAFFSEGMTANQDTLKQWYKRVMQVPLIREGNFYYFFDDVNRRRIESYSDKYKYINKEEFMKKFYGKD